MSMSADSVFSALTVAQLRNILKSRGLVRSGNRAELVDRLTTMEWRAEINKDNSEDAVEEVMDNESGATDQVNVSAYHEREIVLYKREKELAERELVIARREIEFLRRAQQTDNASIDR